MLRSGITLLGALTLVAEQPIPHRMGRIWRQSPTQIQEGPAWPTP